MRRRDALASPSVSELGMIDDRAPGARGPAEARSTPLALLLDHPRRGNPRSFPHTEYESL